MTYKAIVCRLTNVRANPKLHSLNVATVHGHQILVSKDTKEGTLGVFYPSDGCIADTHLKANNLYRKGLKVTDPGSSRLEVGQIVTKREYDRVLSGSVNTKGFTAPTVEEVSMGGYFEDNGRVRVVKFQSVESDGYWHPIEGYFEWAGPFNENIDIFTEGQEIDKVGGHHLCQKYMTPATRRALASRNGSKGSAAANRGTNLPQHYDTDHLERAMHHIPEGSIMFITEKLHGTSGRTGYVIEEVQLGAVKRLWNSVIGDRTGARFDNKRYMYVSGTRRVTLNTFHNPPKQTRAKRLWNSTVGRITGLRYPEPIVRDEGYYQGSTFRLDIHKDIANTGLRKGECLYYEIVGFDETGRQIMSSHQVNDSGMKKKFGDVMNYTYGCNQIADTFLGVNSHIDSREFLDKIRSTMGVNVRLGECSVYVYRITQLNEDGEVVELGWDAVKRRCRELGLSHVPELDRFIYDGNAEQLKDRCRDLASKRSVLDTRHISEGVCVRVSNDVDDRALKYKSWHFRDMEGIRKNDDDYVDIEEFN